MKTTKYYNQTEISIFLGMNTVVLGKKLIDMGIRRPTGRLPTQEALDKKFAKIIRDNNNMFTPVWTKELLQFLMEKEQVSEEKAQANLLAYSFKDLLKYYRHNNTKNADPNIKTTFGFMYFRRYETFHEEYSKVKQNSLIIEEFCKNIAQYSAWINENTILNKEEREHYKTCLEKIKINAEVEHGQKPRKASIL